MRKAANTRGARSRRVWRRTLLVAASLGLAALAAAGAVAPRVGAVLSRFAAKAVCSCVFVSGRDEAACLADEAAPYDALLRVEVDRVALGVTARVPLGPPARADYRDGLGCALR